MSKGRDFPASDMGAVTGGRVAEPRASALPVGCLPRGMCREAAAAYIGCGTTKFDEMVAEGLMPRPKHIGARRVWDVRALDAAFEALPTDEERNEWDAA